MFKRATWLTVGFGLGVGTTVAAARQVRKRVNRYQPHAVVRRVGDTLTVQLSSVRDQLAAAIEEGRAVARAREAELRGRSHRFGVIGPVYTRSDNAKTIGGAVDGTISSYGGAPDG